MPKRNFLDKNLIIRDLYDKTLNKLIGLFNYNNLPLSVPIYEMERRLLQTGKVAIIKYENELRCYDFTFCDKFDFYGYKTSIWINNPYVGLSQKYEIGKDCVVIFNTPTRVGLHEYIGKLSQELCEIDITLNTIATLNRVSLQVSASDTATAQSAQMYIDKILRGELSVIAENAFLKGCEIKNIGGQSDNRIIQLIEQRNYIYSNFWNMFGLGGLTNYKRQRLTQNESEENDKTGLFYYMQMYESRLKGIIEINEMFGTNIEITNLVSKDNESETLIVTSEMVETEVPNLENETVETERNEYETVETERNENETVETERNENETVETERNEYENDNDNDKQQ